MLRDIPGHVAIYENFSLFFLFIKKKKKKKGFRGLISIFTSLLSIFNINASVEIMI